MKTVLLVRRLEEIRVIHWHQSSMEHSFPSGVQVSIPSGLVTSVR